LHIWFEYQSFLSTRKLKKKSSSAGEFHPYALTDPDVTVSRHPALIDQPQVSIPSANRRITSARDVQSDPTSEPHPTSASEAS
jgi:hypothetical protein